MIRTSAAALAPVEDTVRVTATFHLVDAIHGESRRAVTITCQRYGERWKGTGFTFED